MATQTQIDNKRHSQVNVAALGPAIAALTPATADIKTLDETFAAIEGDIATALAAGVMGKSSSPP